MEWLEKGILKHQATPAAQLDLKKIIDGLIMIFIC